MIVKNTTQVTLPESLPIDRQKYYIDRINEFHSMVNLMISNELALSCMFPCLDNEDYEDHDDWG